ncbi:hypothetical protein SK128_019234 [Halocaridina rubra]|uniref:Uncharacterized protein n=1 Tax=Halocaridina rubra TaxID=373956 RepID=A0AAN8WSN9_HALRR
MMTLSLMVMMILLVILVITATADESTNSPLDRDSISLTDISWMGETEKILQNFIIWYKLQLQTAANVLNPKSWNLDIIMPSISGVISLYTGPIIALILILLVFSTLTTFVVGLLNNPTFRSSAGNGWSSTIDAISYAVHQAIEARFHHPQNQSY